MKRTVKELALWALLGVACCALITCGTAREGAQQQPAATGVATGAIAGAVVGGPIGYGAGASGPLAAEAYFPEQEGAVSEKEAKDLDRAWALMRQKSYAGTRKIVKDVRYNDPANESVRALDELLTHTDQGNVTGELNWREETERLDVLRKTIEQAAPYYHVAGFPDGKDWKDIIGAREGVPYPSKAKEYTPEEKEVLKNLGMKVQLAFDETPLTGVVEFLQEVTPVNFTIHRPDLPPDAAPITLHVQTTLRNALDEICSLSGMAWKVEGPVIKIASAERLKEYELRVYDIRDLILDLEDRLAIGEMSLTQQSARSSGTTTTDSAATGDSGIGVSRDERMRNRALALAELITKTGKPEGWTQGGQVNGPAQTWGQQGTETAGDVRGAGGTQAGARAFFRGGNPGDLIVIQTADVHAQIEELLQDLRKESARRTGLPEELPSSPEQKTLDRQAALQEALDALIAKQRVQEDLNRKKAKALAEQAVVELYVQNNPTEAKKLAQQALTLDPENQVAQKCLWAAHVGNLAETTPIRLEAMRQEYAKATQEAARLRSEGKMAESEAASRKAQTYLNALLICDTPEARKLAAERALNAFRADELWIIVRAEAKEQPVGPQYDTPGAGALMAKLPNFQREVPVPLKHTDVKAQISAYIATVAVTQQFHNPYDSKIEAVYVFPLPENAAVNEFIMTVGDRRIRGIIRERQEAEKIYYEARAQGYVASLLTQERPNVFTQKVANIEPGKEIDVNIKYFHTLAYVDGWYEFVFPMVVGPRFNPPGQTDGVGAAARGAGGVSGQSTEVQYLAPGERSGHDISLSVDVDAGVTIEEIKCASHAIERKPLGQGRMAVSLSALDTIPNKDFVLRYRVAGDRVKSALLTHRDERGGFFTMMIYPPADLASLKRSPMEMVFVLDCSGSMSGTPIAQAKAAAEQALKCLQPGDSFQLIQFSINASQLGPAPIEATPENVRRGLKYLESLEGEGGTMMIEGIKAALDFPHDPKRLRVVAFLTDGYIGNEAEILAAVHEKAGASRIFSFGVGSSVNRYLLDRMAWIGRGAVAYLGPRDSGAEVMDLFFQRISHPALTDISVQCGRMEVADVYPRQVPDLFVGRPVILTGRFRGDGRTDVTVRGKVGGEDCRIVLPVDMDDRSATHAGLPAVWARTRIEDLATQATHDSDPAIPAEIKTVALTYGLMSAYTAFVAVDSLSKTAGESGTTVAVPVPVPEGVRYETTVQER